MTGRTNDQTTAASLRQRAEVLERQREASEMGGILSSDASSALIHELRVHQIELEMQNEELRWTQVQLNNSRKRYFELYDLAPVGYFLLNAQGHILEANSTFAAMLGVGKPNLRNQPISRFVYNQDQDKYYLYRKSVEAGGLTVMELRLVKKDGSQLWVRLEANLAQDAGGITIIRVAASDITQLKLAEQALKSSQNRYQALANQSFDALLLVDIETREVVEVNRRFSELLGYFLPEDAPLSVNKIMVDSDSNLDEGFNDTLSGQHHLPCESRLYRHQSGREVPVEQTGTVVNIDGRDYLLNSLRDMTVERRRKSDMLRDVEFARRVQQGLLPELTDSPYVTIATLYYPSHFVSGDSFLLEWRDEGKLLRGFLFDVSGHGVATALQTASINVLLREAASAKNTLLEQLQWVNERAAKYFAEGSYAAIIGFELDLSSKELRYIGAGITQFYTNRKKIETPGMFVGMWNDAKFITGVLSIKIGDVFCFLTDGFTDLLAQPENVGFWSTASAFDEDVAVLEHLAVSGKLSDDATGICLKIKKL